MKRFAATLVLASVFYPPAYAGDYNLQKTTTNTATTTTTSGTVSKPGSDTFVYGQQSTFSTSTTPGSNPHNSQSTTTVGVGVRY